MSQKKIIAPLIASMPSVVRRPSRPQGRTTQKYRQTTAATGTAIWIAVYNAWWPLDTSSGPGGVGLKFGPKIHRTRTTASKAMKAVPIVAHNNTGRDCRGGVSVGNTDGIGR